MSNPYYDHTTYPATSSTLASSPMRSELDSIEAGFDKLPTLSGNGGKITAVNSGGTAIEAITTTGTGSGVRATSPALVTPLLGTPTSGVLTNCTGTAAGLTAGNVTTNANLTGHVTSTGNAAVLGSFTAAQLNTAISDADIVLSGANSSITSLSGLTTPLSAAQGGTGDTLGTSWVPLKTGIVASSQASVEFTSIPTSGYSAWKIIISNLLPATDATFLQMRFKIAGTDAPNSYWYTARVFGTDGGASGLSNASDLTTVLTGLSMSNTGTGFSGEITIANPGLTSINKTFFQNAAYKLSSGVYVLAPAAGGYFGATSAFDGLTFFMNSGNIASARIDVYGLKNS